MANVIKIKLDGVEELEKELKRLSVIRFDGIVKKNLTQMLNRARSTGGTPVDTGELRKSSGVGKEEMGYTKDYAPHVELGHRTVNGGYVAGQRFLYKNLETQKKIYKQDLIDELKEGGK